MPPFNPALIDSLAFTLPLAPTASVSTISGIQWGDPLGEPILFVHGWLDNCASFYPFIEQCSQYNCIAIDLPGHGHSAHKAAGYHFIDWVDDLYQIITALYQQRLICDQYAALHYVGHSLGALVGSVFCSVFPKQIATLTMIEGLGPLYADIDESVSQLRRTILARSRRNSKKTRYFPSVDAAVRRWLAVSDLEPEQATMIVERNLVLAKSVSAPQHTDYWQWRYDPRLTERSALRMSQAQARYFCEQIQCRVMLLRATSGSYISEQAVNERSCWFSSLSCCSLGKGHHLHFSSAKAVALKITGFITSDNGTKQVQ